MTGYCHPWIPAYGEIAKPLYAMLMTEVVEPLEWGKIEVKAFEQLKEAIARTPVLGIPDYEKPFTLFVN